MRTTVRCVLAKIQFKQLCSALGWDPKPPLTGMPKTAEYSWKFWISTLPRCDHSLPLVQSTSTTSQAVERRRVHSVLLHDPITISHELLQGRRSKGLQVPFVSKKGIGFAEKKPIRDLKLFP